MKNWKRNAILLITIIIIFPLSTNISLAKEETGVVGIEWDQGGTISPIKYNYGIIWASIKDENSIIALVAFEYTKKDQNSDYTHKLGKAQEIEVGIDPTALIKSPDNKYIYFTNQGEETVGALDIKKMPPKLLEKVKVKQSPNNIMLSPDGKYLFLTHEGDNEILIYRSSIFTDGIRSSAKDDLIGRIVLNEGDTIDSMAFRPDAQQIWLTNQNTNEIIIINVKNLEIITKIKAPNPKNIWFSRDSETVYITMLETNSVWVINTEDLTYEIVEIGGTPECLIGTPDGGELLICNPENKGLSIIRTSDLTHKLIDIGTPSKSIVIVEGIKNVGNSSREIIAIIFSEENSKTEENKKLGSYYGGIGEQTVMTLFDLGTERIVKRTTHMPILTSPIYDNSYEPYRMEYRRISEVLEDTNKGLKSRIAELIFEGKLAEEGQRKAEKAVIDAKAQNYGLIISTLIFLASTIFFAYKMKKPLQKGEKN